MALTYFQITACSFLLLLALNGCSRPDPPAIATPKAPPVNLQHEAAKWQYPESKVVSGGTTAGLHQSTFSTSAAYEKVWEFYAGRVGYGGRFSPDALQVASECSSGPCTAYSVTSANTPGLRSATFAYRGPSGGIVASVRRAEKSRVSEVHLTIIAP